MSLITNYGNRTFQADFKKMKSKLESQTGRTLTDEQVVNIALTLLEEVLNPPEGQRVVIVDDNAKTFSPVTFS